MRCRACLTVVTAMLALLPMPAQPSSAQPPAVTAGPTPGPSGGVVGAPVASTRPTATVHPPVPARLESMWLAPSGAATLTLPLLNFARGVQLLEDGGNAREALPLVTQPALAKSDVATYARYYTGVALQRLQRLDEAETAFTAVNAREASGHLALASVYRRAELREARGDYGGAIALYQQVLAAGTVPDPQIALLRLAAAEASLGDRVAATGTLRRVLREHALTPQAVEGERLLGTLGGLSIDTPDAARDELTRAETLFAARRYEQARDIYERLRQRAPDDTQHRLTLRLAQVQAAQGQHRQARDVFRRFTGHETLAAEARHGLLMAARALNDHGEANDLTEDFVARYPTHPLTESALNEMARHYVLGDDDGRAADIYTRMIDRFPAGPLAERGSWKAGWWAYRQKNFAETIRVFERAAVAFPRSDYRPAWLYWTARSYEQANDRPMAIERYRLVTTDYHNTYYGRLTWPRLQALGVSTLPASPRATAPPANAPPNAGTIRSLIAAGLYRPALSELQYAQRVWGDSALLQATVGLVHYRIGNLRLGINAMKRAYPQFMTADGETLPIDIQRIIFPLDYWPLLKGNAQAQGIDPFILAALAAQESTFDARIRSSANAIGLLQIIPPTGRQLARRIGMRRFDERSLENPEISARLGALYFGNMVKEFGGYHFALAGYNAGESRVERWNREAPGLPQDEWIDNIPFFETQNYVKRILGTAEDYRRLYGDGPPPTAVTRKPAVKPSTSAAASKAAARAKATAKKPPAKKAPAKKTPTKRTPTKKTGR